MDDKGAPLPAGEIGGIEVKGPNVFKGYWRMPEKTADEFTTDLWFKTGDVGRIDADGYVTIVGRSKDLIISGGYNVYPAEIEGTLNDMPGVAESAVVGVPHPDFGEAVVAVVVPKPGAALDGAACGHAEGQHRQLQGAQAVFVVPDLPRNAMGKVQKNLLRDQHKGLVRRRWPPATTDPAAPRPSGPGCSHRPAPPGDRAATWPRWPAALGRGDRHQRLLARARCALAAAWPGAWGTTCWCRPSASTPVSAPGTTEAAPWPPWPTPRCRRSPGETYGGLKAAVRSRRRRPASAAPMPDQPPGPAGRPARPDGPLHLVGAAHAPGGAMCWRRAIRPAPVQFIDARDAAAWMLLQAERQHPGASTCAGPGSP
jgi:hypothetical protein